MTQRSEQYAQILDVPTDVLAKRFVGALILAKGDRSKYEAITAHMIRELRGEPHPYKLADGVSEDGK